MPAQSFSSIPSDRRFLVITGALTILPEDPRPTSWVDVPQAKDFWGDCHGSPSEAVTREEALAQVERENRESVMSRGGDFWFADWSIVFELGVTTLRPGFHIDAERGALTVESETAIRVVRPTGKERGRYAIPRRELGRAPAGV